MIIDFNLFSFVVSCILAILSVVLGIFSIWQSKAYRDESTAINNISKGILDEIKTHSIVITQYAIPELKAYGESSRKYIFEVKRPEAAEIQHTITTQAPPAPIRHDILEEIKLLTTHSGRVTALSLVDRLQIRYTFAAIMAELIYMNKEGILKWDGAPSPPDALSEITVDQKGQGQ